MNQFENVLTTLAIKKIQNPFIFFHAFFRISLFLTTFSSFFFFFFMIDASFVTLMGRGYDANPCLCLKIDESRYIFNTPPNALRAAHSHKIGSVKKVFLTSLLPYASSGYQVFCKTSFTEPAKYDAVAPYFFHEFMMLDINIMKCDARSLEFTNSFSSEELDVESIKMLKSQSFDIHIHVTKHSKKIDFAEILKKKKLSPGPWLRILKKNGVYSDQNFQIKMQDLYDIKKLDSRILLIDAEDKSDIDNMKNLIPHLEVYDAIIHYTPMELMDSYYFELFPQNIPNFCFHDDGTISLLQSYMSYNKYAANCDCLRPIPCENITPKLPNHFVSLSSGDIINLYDMKNVVKKHIMNDNIRGELPISRLNNTLLTENALTFDYFAITFLGTCSGSPSTDRNSSGYLLHLPDGFIVLDCANGYYQQMCRKFGKKNAQTILKNLKCIWISHCHADHILGLPDLLYERSFVTDEKVILACDSIVASQIGELELKYKYYFRGHGYKSDFSYNYIYNDRKQPIIFKGEHPTRIDSVPVSHCFESMGCVITLENNFRIGFTGDMIANDDFKNGIGHCDLLISDTTYPDYKASNAFFYCHMTVSQSCILKEEVKAEYLIMTHNSPSLYRNFEMPEESNAIFPFDYLCIPDIHMKEIFDAVRKNEQS